MKDMSLRFVLLFVATALVSGLALTGCEKDVSKPAAPEKVDARTRPEPNILDGIRVDGTEFTRVEDPDGTVRHVETGYHYLEAQINGAWVIVGTTADWNAARQEADKRRQHN